MKHFNEVAHHYIDAKLILDSKEFGFIESVNRNKTLYHGVLIQKAVCVQQMNQDELRHNFDLRSMQLLTYHTPHVIKPLLRTLESMDITTAKHCIELLSPVYLNIDIKIIDERGIRFEFEYKSSRRRRTDWFMFGKYTPDQFDFLTSKGYDLFKLIDNE